MGDAFNPYEAPRADGEQQPLALDPFDLVDASPGARLGNFVIDLAVRSLLVAAVSAMTGPDIGAVLGMLSLVFYYVMFEWLLEATPGKMITRTRVVRTDGGKPRFLQLLGRTLARYVPFEPFSFLGSAGWHDRWSGTRVVKR